MSPRSAAMVFCLALAAAIVPAFSAGAQPPARLGSPHPDDAAPTQTIEEPASAPASGPATARALPATLEECREAYMKGDYAVAETGYRRLASKASMRVSAAVGLAQCLAMRGEYAKALDCLQAAEQAGRKSAQWQLACAEILAVKGRYEEALARAVEAGTLRPDWAPAIAVAGGILETLGRKDQARSVYRSVDKVFSSQGWRDDAANLAAIGRILDRCAILEGRKASEQAANILHNYLQEAYLRVDGRYWPAHVAAGQFLMSKHKWPAAKKEFALVLKINPHVPEALAGLAEAELHDWRFEECLALADRALAVNARHSQARLVKAACLMQWRKFQRVGPLLDAVLDVNPNNLEALCLYAALHMRLGEQDKAQPYMERVEKIHPGYPGLPNTIGEWLSAARWFDQAELHFRKAVELGPELAEPLTNLGLLYMQTGQEDKAKEILEKAHRLDDFRADVFNYLKLLDELEGFMVRQTEHFVIKVDGRHDAILLDQVAAYMERIYPEVCGAFDHQPAEKTIIEIFPTHQQFSVRISGRAWIGTIGAATGKVIVLVAPNERRSEFGTFNWATVLRHEFTHTVTIAASKNRLPHWFTEACAVWQQPDRMNYEAAQALVAATQGGRLFAVRELDWGFVRPKRGGDRMLAYAQAEWMLEYIIATGGYEKVIAMLRAFGEGKTQSQVFASVLGASEEQFDKAFADWAKSQVRKWGYEPSPPPDLDKAQRSASENPNDPAAQATLAKALLLAGRHQDAQKAAQKALDLDESNLPAVEVLAKSLLASDKLDEALLAARRLQELDGDSRDAARVQAECYLRRRQWAHAIAALEQLKQRAPLDGHSYTKLAELYTQLGQPANALPNLVELHRRTLKDPQYARRIADIYRAARQEDLALRYYEQIMQINPYESSAYQAAATIHLYAERYDQSIASMNNYCLLEPSSAEAWAGLAMIRYQAAKATGDRSHLEPARQAARKALEIDPECQGREVLEYIEELERPQ